ncbi:SDR family NAD(P)-dependent oxidoreductase [Tenggerimyces flavus]|uniref:SDR family NAD(P)-dependent oxidoreductase n=1 Tax=Tenggerimyces flavus TaxID=1708749 RepID=A0ABV7YBL5_9ACTN|nr:SDR family oxidoreductase [Tenggerimyces flavus]MBM7791304.1 NAD(P)-dependent dehydrogenase (short-subunit alcohol dehydrogenase family) [Tenggerimyces flavus]
MGILDGKTALVTGGSRGIGRAIAERLASDGALVAVHYGSNETAAKEAVAAIEAAGGRAFAVRALLGTPGDVDTLFAGLERGLEGRGLDIVVNNAAIQGYGASTLEGATEADFERTFAINARAPLFIVQRALPLMSEGGRIINISSGVTWFAIPEVVYAMTKGALNVMTRSLAHVLGERGITVNTVSPGITETDMNQWLVDSTESQRKVAAMVALGRHGQPDDLADAVAFFASPDSRWVTGQTLEVNGGLWLGPREER